MADIKPQRRERHGIAEDLLAEILEPHESLRYVARLFKALAALLILLLIAEVVLGLARQGTEAVPLLLEEATRLIVFAGTGASATWRSCSSNPTMTCARRAFWSGSSTR